MRGKVFELFFCEGELAAEFFIGMKSRHNSRGHNPCGIDIALEMIAADHPAFTDLKSASEDLVLSCGIYLGENQSRRPSDGGVSRRI